MRKQIFIVVLLLISLMSKAQEKSSLETIRIEFQEIKNEADIEKILAFEHDRAKENELKIIKAYQAAGTCMMANYVFSPISKLKYFNNGKKNLEQLISEGKEVENVYLRLLIQLNVPRMLNYHKDIEDDMAYLERHMSTAPIELSYKNTMIMNLVSITKNKDLKDALLQINVEEES